MYSAANEVIHAAGPLFQRTFGSECLVGPFIIGGYLIWHFLLEQSADLPELLAKNQTATGMTTDGCFLLL